MSKLSEKVSYLRGLTDGLNQDPDLPQSKIIAEVISALELAAQKLDHIEEQVDDLSEYIDEVDKDLAEVEDFIVEETGGAEDDECECGCHHGDDFDNDFVAYQCPNCGSEVELDVEELDTEDNPTCPECGKPIFEEEQ